jgi:saccharopine dehydrogenase (NAD+, L-lysine-forming)
MNSASLYRVGCTLVEHNSWNKAPAGTLIIGLKELPVSTEPISHTHIQFAHCYKRQGGWVDVLRRFSDGKGTLYDLEFLTDEQKRRVAAFGYHAGFAGSAAGALAFASRKKGKVLGSLEPYENQDAMIKHVHDELVGDSEKEVTIKVLAMGALGRCGSGAVGLFQQVLDRYAPVPTMCSPTTHPLFAYRNKEMGNKKLNIEILKWDLEETKKGGPFQEILDGMRRWNRLPLNLNLTHTFQSTSSLTAFIYLTKFLTLSTTRPSTRRAAIDGSQ